MIIVYDPTTGHFLDTIFTKNTTFKLDFCNYLDNSSLAFNTFSNCSFEIVLGKNVKTGTV